MHARQDSITKVELHINSLSTYSVLEQIRIVYAHIKHVYGDQHVI